MKYDVIIIGAGPLRVGTVQSGQRKNVSAANPALLRRALPEPEHFPTANYPFLRTSVEICRRFLDMTGPLSY